VQEWKPKAKCDWSILPQTTMITIDSPFLLLPVIKTPTERYRTTCLITHYWTCDIQVSKTNVCATHHPATVQHITRAKHHPAYLVRATHHPAYLEELLHLHVPGRKNLKSSVDNTKQFAPRTRTKRAARGFSSAAAAAWNELPQCVRECKSRSVFRGQLKSFLYRRSTVKNWTFDVIHRTCQLVCWLGIIILILFQTRLSICTPVYEFWRTTKSKLLLGPTTTSTINTNAIHKVSKQMEIDERVLI